MLLGKFNVLESFNGIFLLFFDELGENAAKSLWDEELPSEGDDGQAFWNYSARSLPALWVTIILIFD